MLKVPSINTITKQLQGLFVKSSVKVQNVIYTSSCKSSLFYAGRRRYTCWRAELDPTGELHCSFAICRAVTQINSTFMDDESIRFWRVRAKRRCRCCHDGSWIRILRGIQYPIPFFDPHRLDVDDCRERRCLNAPILNNWLGELLLEFPDPSWHVQLKSDG